MACGTLAVIDRGSGPGLAVRSVHTGRLQLGTSPGSVKRGIAHMTTGVEAGYRVIKALLDIGMTLEEGVQLPVRMKIILDGVSVAREFKPQFICEGDEGRYAKAVYDVRPVAASRLQERPRHRLVVLYDASRRVSLDEAGLLVVYDVPEAWSSYVYMAGVVPVRPNEEVILTAKLPETRQNPKIVYASLVLPSRFSEVEVRVGGTVRLVSGVVGPVLVEAPARVRGDQLRVSVDYRSLARPVYPRIAFVTGLSIIESVAPAARLAVEVDRVDVEDGRVRLALKITNSGLVKPEKVMVVASALGIPLKRLEVDPVDPGSESSVDLSLDMARLPASAGRIVVRVVWNNYGRVFFEEVEVDV